MSEQATEADYVTLELVLFAFYDYIMFGFRAYVQ